MKNNTTLEFRNHKKITQLSLPSSVHQPRYLGYLHSRLAYIIFVCPYIHLHFTWKRSKWLCWHWPPIQNTSTTHLQYYKVWFGIILRVFRYKFHRSLCPQPISILNLSSSPTQMTVWTSRIFISLIAIWEPFTNNVLP